MIFVESLGAVKRQGSQNKVAAKLLSGFSRCKAP